MSTGDHDTSIEPVELDGAGHALLSGLRAIAVGRAECPAVRRMFADLFGRSGNEALNVLFVFVRQLAFSSKRRLRVHLPGCSAISGDEMIFLSAISAAQCEGASAERGMGQWISRLAGRSDVAPTLAHTLKALGELLSESGCKVTFDQASRPTESPPLHSRVLH